METYATALLYAIPFFVGLVLLEILYGYVVKNQKYTVLDTVSSLSSGLTNIIKDSLGLVVILISYPFLLEHLALIEIKNTWLVWVVAFIAIDFAGYWNHRLSHHINIFWNQHVIHHSSEEFNLACALRQPIANLIGYYALLLIPAALLGVPNQVIAILAPIHLFAQFWYHTQHIGKLGWLEYVLVTPSQHRVHHAINAEYIDKNLGQILSVWDRLFGTFQEELEDVPPQYGVLKPAGTWNPVLINFQHFWRMCLDAFRTRNWWDRLRIWFMPTGWRPADVIEKYPIVGIDDVYNFKKYSSDSSFEMKAYAIFQLLTHTILLLYMFSNFETIGFPNLFYMAAFIFIGIFAYTSIMDQQNYGAFIEVVRGVVGLGFIYLTNDWFGLKQHLEVGVVLIFLYFIISIISALYFYFKSNYRLPTNSDTELT